MAKWDQKSGIERRMLRSTYRDRLPITMARAKKQYDGERDDSLLMPPGEEEEEDGVL